MNGRKDGWIDQLGTLARGAGAGWRRSSSWRRCTPSPPTGSRMPSIGVDSESPTGAARLYRRLGFEPVQRAIDYEIALDA